MFSVYEIATKLIGPVKPVGETNEDQQRFANLQHQCDLLQQLLEDIEEVARVADGGRASYMHAKKSAKVLLSQLRDSLEL